MIPLKHWETEEAAREHVTRSAIFRRRTTGKKRGQYKNRIRLKRVNPRVVFVVELEPV